MPSVTKYVDVEVTVDVDLDDFDDDELIEECKNRGIWPNQVADTTSNSISELYEAYTAGKDITEQLRKVFDVELGRII